MNHYELGAMGEVYVQRVLSGVGLNVDFGGPGDLVADGVAIEVKAARKGPYRARAGDGYQFCLHRAGRGGVQADVVVMLCYWREDAEPVAFVVPAEMVGKRRKVVIPGDPWAYGGKWSRWYRRWDVIADLLDGRED